MVLINAMEDSEFVLKKLCCTCLSRDRKLSQLCKLKEGINNLYLLLSFDSEAYREGFYKDTANWYICWECWAVMVKISRFRSQACLAQRQLADIADGRGNSKHLNASLSHLTVTQKLSIDLKIIDNDPIDNFIDCGPDIKTESDEDLPLSMLHDSMIEREDSDENEGEDRNREVITKKKEKKNNIDVHYKTKVPKNLKKRKKIPDKIGLNCDSNKYFRRATMSQEEMLERRERRKLDVLYTDAQFKCESCIEGYKNQNDLDLHVRDEHTIDYMKKGFYTQCDICLCYIKNTFLSEHSSNHYMRLDCQFCDYVVYSLNDILSHLKSEHALQNFELPVEKKKPRSKLRKGTMLDLRTAYGYLCIECNKYFKNKNQRWKHIQSAHREGYKCVTCGKRFAFRNNLKRHEQMHVGPPPREECGVCHKMVRVDLLKNHSKIHTQRDRFSCAECDKCFVSRASYEHHLKYTQAHSATDILKYKCATCDKGYRSRGELRDHVNYQHMGKTHHKCPICGKGLATRRCITRHVRRAHDGVKENTKDKICQQCGKAFRDKKCLREHEFIHTGERPLSCEVCGCTFRQSASLYTHKKRVHKIYPSKKTVTVVEGGVEGAKV